MEIEILHPNPSREMHSKPTLSVGKCGLIFLNKKAIKQLGLKSKDNMTLGHNNDGWYLITGPAAKDTFKMRTYVYESGGFNSSMIVYKVFEWYAQEHNLIKSEVEAIKTLRFLILNNEVKPGIHGLADCVALEPRAYKRK